MSYGRRAGFIRQISLCLGAIAVIAAIGGCPVPQVPREPADNGNQNGTVGGTTANNNSGVSGPVRPIPGVPIEVEQPDDETTDDANDLITDVPTATPLGVAITNFENSLNILPGTSALVAYEVLGGRREDGDVRVTVFADIDGVDRSGDERTLLENQPLRALVEIPTRDLTPGRYFVAVRAQNNVSTATRYTLGRLEIVGAALLSAHSPSGSTRLRPTDIAEIRASISTIAQTVSWRVFVDSDTEFNGNEIFEFCSGGPSCSLAGGGASVQGGIVLQTLQHNNTYFIGVEIKDSLGQTFIRYFGSSDCAATSSCHSIQIDAAPEIEVTEPASTLHIQPGTQDVRIVARVSDPESSAVVRLFRDSDSTINGNEFELETFNLSNTTGEFETIFSTAGLLPGTYRLGAEVDDGAGPPVARYAPGQLVILEPPSVFGQFELAFLPGRRLDPQNGNPNLNDPVIIQFNVLDPLRRLAFQPEGIRLNLYLDANTNGVPDSTTPLVSTTVDHLNRPFEVGVNQFEITLSTLGISLNDPDQLIDLRGELVLRENGGNQVTLPSLFPVARMDGIRPHVTALSPDLDVSVRRENGTLEIIFRATDNDGSIAVASLVPIVPDGEPPPPAPEIFLGELEDVVFPGVNIIAMVPIPDTTPLGDYHLRLRLFDTTEDVTVFNGFNAVITVIP